MVSIVVDLDPSLATGEAVLRILRPLLAEVQGRAPGAALGVDPEELHQLRVAVRRSRVAVRQLRHGLNSEDHRWLARELRWLGRTTNLTRDLDVAAEALPRALSRISLDEEGRDAVKRWLRLRREAEQVRLGLLFGSHRFPTLIQGWSRIVDRSQGLKSRGPEESSLGPLAAKKLRKAHRRLRRRLTDIDASTPSADLHEARLAAKKLRYLLEFFGSLFSASAVGESSDGAEGSVPEIKASLKRLQRVLGAFQDAVVHRELFQQWAVRSWSPHRSAFLALAQEADLRQQEAREQVRPMAEEFLNLEASYERAST